MLAEEKSKLGTSIPSSAEEPSKSYGSSEAVSRAIFSYTTMEQGLQAQQVIPC